MRTPWLEAIAQVPTYARFAAGLPRYLRTTWTPAAAAAAVRERLARREENFFRALETAFAAGRDGVYPRLFAAAGVDPRDLPPLVARDGLEATLERLLAAGIYVTFEEFKGRQPIVRGGIELTPAPRFDNPRRSSHYVAQSGGSTGEPTRVAGDLGHLAAQAANELLAQQAHGTLGAPTAIWFDAFPDGTGVNCSLRLASSDQMPRRWFSLLRAQGYVAEPRSRVANRLLFGLSRLAGRPLPAMEPLALEQAVELARWAARTVEREGRAVVFTHVSKCLRVALAAREAGIDLAGVTFWGGGEPPTEAKVRPLYEAGARWLPGYWLREAGSVAQGCAAPDGPNDLHLHRDAFAMITRPRPIPGFPVEVPALLFTALLPTAPKLMFNVECDDFAILERRACGCPLGELGLDVHVRDVRSFSKLTGEGVTLLAGELERVLEEVLPTECGGTALDYQLVERENDRGFTELVVVVHPSVPLADENRVVETVRQALANGSGAMHLAGALLGEAGAIRVERARPQVSLGGKHVPILLAASARPRPRESGAVVEGAL